MNAPDFLHPRHAVFDLDGTLADTAPDLIGTLNRVLAAEGAPPLPLERAGALLGAGARALIERGLAAADKRVTPERLEELFQAFLEDYGRNLANESRLYPGVEGALDALEAEGWRLAVCTNKMEGHARALLRHLGVLDRFDFVAGRESFVACKPDPRHLVATIDAARRAGKPLSAAAASTEAAAAEQKGDALRRLAEVDRCVMIGDSITDLRAARAARVPCVLVSFGYTDVPARELGADRVIDHFDELPAAMRELAQTPGAGGAGEGGADEPWAAWWARQGLNL